MDVCINICTLLFVHPSNRIPILPVDIILQELWSFFNSLIEETVFKLTPLPNRFLISYFLVMCPSISELIIGQKHEKMFSW